MTFFLSPGTPRETENLLRMGDRAVDHKPYVRNVNQTCPRVIRSHVPEWGSVIIISIVLKLVYEKFILN